MADEEEEEDDDEGDGDKEPGDAEAAEPVPTKFSDWIKTLSPDAHCEVNIPKEAQVKKSIDRVLALIHKEAAALGGDYSRVFLGGWSQGAVLAPLVALDKDCPPIGGVFSLCGTLHADKVAAALKEPVKSTPMLFIIAAKDDYYSPLLIKPVIERLQAGGYKVELREKPMTHTLCGQVGDPGKVEERWIRQFIEGFYEKSSLGALMEAHPSEVRLDAKDQKAAMEVVYKILFGSKLPGNKKGAIMKHSVWDGTMSDMNKRVEKLSAADLTL